ncbi:GNAT family N-acetyltransferase [Streptomyces sp. ms191]|uniref:GNAT family N-acetyltransferase n=1 Tax=Streptomyces sp. ms191 TaxID=1827978 RepID=UPI0011CD365F|nr:GNAT family N-acetyltransferase [Streptomyces sp. ms191]TXS29128.1 GNAT family N-acetyltransferase [Streptomyces sp. ms191]
MSDLAYRVAGPSDQSALAGLDDSFTTDYVYEVAAGDIGFGLRLVPVDPPLVKVYPDDGDAGDAATGADDAGSVGKAGAAYDTGTGPDGSGAHEIVAVDSDGALRGFVAVAHERWNRRLVIRRITVDSAHRGRGIGGELMRRALAHGRAVGARTAWLEVTSVNVPAVRAYRRMGFRLCGLDTTLYTGTASEGETALFMARPLT